MYPSVTIIGALMIAAPLFSQNTWLDPQVRDAKVIWLQLTETRGDVYRLAGPPRLEADFGDGFVAWQYRAGGLEHDDFSHYLVFRKSDGKLIAVTRNYESEQNVDPLFPEAETTVYRDRSTRFSVRARPLGDGRVLLAMGAAQAGDTTTQLVLIRSNVLRNFYPWLSDQMGVRGGDQ